MELKTDKDRDLQKFYNAVEKAKAKHLKALGLNTSVEIMAETGRPNADTIQYFITTHEGKKKLLIKAKLTYKPFFEIKRYKL